MVTVTVLGACQKKKGTGTWRKDNLHYFINETCEFHDNFINRQINVWFISDRSTIYSNHMTQGQSTVSVYITL